MLRATDMCNGTEELSNPAKELRPLGVTGWRGLVCNGDETGVVIYEEEAPCFVLGLTWPVLLREMGSVSSISFPAVLSAFYYRLIDILTSNCRTRYIGYSLKMLSIYAHSTHI